MYERIDFIYIKCLIMRCIWSGEKMFVENSPENKSVCLQYCGTCPSYKKDVRKLLFCSRGNLTGEIERTGCKCGMCPVSIKHKLDGGYYCIHGNLDTFLD